MHACIYYNKHVYILLHTNTRMTILLKLLVVIDNELAIFYDITYFGINIS